MYIKGKKIHALRLTSIHYLQYIAYPLLDHRVCSLFQGTWGTRQGTLPGCGINPSQGTCTHIHTLFHALWAIWNQPTLHVVGGNLSTQGKPIK